MIERSCRSISVLGGEDLTQGQIKFVSQGKYATHYFGSDSFPDIAPC